MAGLRSFHPGKGFNSVMREKSFDGSGCKWWLHAMVVLLLLQKMDWVLGRSQAAAGNFANLKM